jgi:hypothetical protein
LKLCAVDNCTSPIWDEGKCREHLLAEIKPKKKNARTCTFPGCENQHAARGYCTSHYGRWRKNGDVNIVRKKGRKKKEIVT